MTEKGYVYKLMGNVYIKTDNYEIFSNLGTYYEDMGVSELSGNVIVRSKDYIIKSEYLKHIQKSDDIYLKGNVYLEDSIRIIKAMEISVKNNFSTAKGNVYIYLKDKRVLATGDSGNYDLNKKEGNIYKVKSIMIFRENDTIKISANEVYIYKENFKLKPLNSLKTSNEFAKGDSLTYQKDSLEKITIYNNAYIKWEDGEGEADTIVIFYKDSKIESAEFINNASVKTRSNDEEIIVNSKLVSAKFSEGKIKKVACRELIEGFTEKIK